MTADLVAISLPEILVPRTDAGALAQVAVAIPLLCGLVYLNRHNREVRTFALGLLVATTALLALRSVH